MMITPDFAGVFLCKQKSNFFREAEASEGKMHDTGE